MIQGETGNILENYLIEDFSIKHTNMGDLLTEVKGIISKMTDNEISIETEEGIMILSLTDENKGEYSVGTSGAILELNLSEIKVGDTLTFYQEGIMESWPMQLNTILITK